MGWTHSPSALLSSREAAINFPAVKQKWNIWLPVAIMLLFALTRWPELMPNNFSAAYALAFCGGVYFSGKWRWIVTLGTLAATDILLNAFYYYTPLLNPYSLITLACFGAITWLGTRFSDKASFTSLLGGGIIGALLFYIVTNTISFIFDPAYSKTLSGWIQALTVGTPGWPHTWEFFRNTLLSGGLFTGLFAGAMKLGHAVEKEEEDQPETEESDSGERAPIPAEQPS
ncbi:MAG: DUF6580 family putative transport protein [Verrucomicrobiales bacterium]